MQYDLARVRELNSAIDPLPVERNGKRGGEGKKKEKGKKCNFGFNGSEKYCGSLCNGVYMYIYIYRGGVFLFFFYSFLYILFFFHPLSPAFVFTGTKCAAKRLLRFRSRAAARSTLDVIGGLVENSFL